MKRSMVVLAIGVIVAGVALVGAADKNKEKPMLAHDVYFTLNDASTAAKTQLVEACRKYLAAHPGTLWFSAGTRAAEFTRDVNVLDFDVALHVVFADKAAHDQYQKTERHMQFIKESKPNWKSVRVFDSYVEAAAHE